MTVYDKPGMIRTVHVWRNARFITQVKNTKFIFVLTFLLTVATAYGGQTVFNKLAFIVTYLVYTTAVYEARCLWR